MIRLSRRIDEWATQQVRQENVELRAQVFGLQAKMVWMHTRYQLESAGRSVELLDSVCMVQNFDVQFGGFPHQYIENEGEEYAKASGIVSARKWVRISGKLLMASDQATQSCGVDGDGDASATPLGRANPVNASVFGTNGVLYEIIIVDASTGKLHTIEGYPGIQHGTPFLVWPNGDCRRGHFRIGPTESSWTACFRFPHVPRDRKDRVLWRLRFAPQDVAIRTRYPALTFETATFHACARLKDE